MAITNISVFRSTDGGAVSGVNGRCSGTIGDGIALLNQLLLTGYNWQAITNANLTASGTVATLALTGHGFNVDQRLWVIGMDQSNYLNGTTYGDATYPASVANPNTLTFPCVTGATSPITTGGGAGGTTTTASAIASTSTTSITVASAAHTPSSIPYVIQIDSEYMLVTAGMGTTSQTVVRGFAGSTAATHSNGATVTQVVVIGVAPAGGFNHWTAPFVATNKSAYLKPGGNQIYLDADDNTAAQQIGVRGWETMSANNTGTGEFPTLGQLAANAESVCKSSAASTAARAWNATATDRMLHLWIDSQNGGANPGSNDWLSFCDLISQTHAGDAYATMIIANSSVATSGSSSVAGTFISSTTAGQYFPRSYTQVGSSIVVGKVPLDGRVAAQTISGAGGLTYPHPEDGGYYFSPIVVNNGAASDWRGIIPGLWDVMHAKPSAHMDTVLGTGPYAGKKFLILNTTNAGQIALEISNTIQAT